MSTKISAYIYTQVDITDTASENGKCNDAKKFYLRPKIEKKKIHSRQLDVLVFNRNTHKCKKNVQN